MSSMIKVLMIIIKQKLEKNYKHIEEKYDFAPDGSCIDLILRHLLEKYRKKNAHTVCHNLVRTVWFFKLKC